MKRPLVATLALFGALATTASAQVPNSYEVHNLASNVPGLAANTNPDVVNAWGLDASATSPWWIADNGTDLSSVLTPTGAALPLRPTVAGGPTGLVARPRGQLRGADNRRICVDGLWALQFGHGAPNNGPVNTLFFTAGPNDEEDGPFGSITAG